MTELEQFLYWPEFQQIMLNRRNRAILACLVEDPFDKDIDYMRLWYKHFKLREKK